ncbi:MULTISPECIES: hypothetical protein [Corynebacterium]|uniref:hypothetical protein n=1 Tax=Corynebacterium TaxID=1716 RepID=UPI0002001AE7|nr:hypothetical protein [Corynebacterium variabile]
MLVKSAPDQHHPQLERVQGSDLNRGGEAGAALVDPPSMHCAGPAGYQVQQAGQQPSLVIAGDVDHPRDLLRNPQFRLLVVPEVLVDTDLRHPVEPVVVVIEVLQHCGHRVPDGVPVHAQLPSQGFYGGMVTA